MPATTTATAGSTWSSPISISRCTASTAAWASGCSPTRRPRAASDRRRCRSSASAWCSSTSTTTRSSISPSPTATSWTTRRSSAPGRRYAQRNLLFRNLGPRPLRRGRPQRRAGLRAGKGGPRARRRATSTTTAISICWSPTTVRPPSCSATTAAAATTRCSSARSGRESNRDGVGAQLRLTAGTRTQIREVKAGSSYLGQNDARQHFGLGTATRADRLEVRWPSGRTEVLQNVAANQIITIREGDGIVGRVPFAR